MLITCDYLEIYLRGNFTGERTENFTFKKKDLGTKIYSEAWNVQYNGVLFGLLLCKPRLKTFPPDACHFKLENEQLYIKYTNSGLSLLIDELKLEYQSVTRLDVACDFHKFEGGVTPRMFVNDFIAGRIQRKGRALATFSPSFAGHELTGVSFGSRASERFGCLYNKTRLLKTENKPYITTYHQENGLTDGDVWRLEFRLRGKEVKRLFRVSALAEYGRAHADNIEAPAGAEHTHLLCPDLLRGVFITELQSYFSFFRASSDTNATRAYEAGAVVLLDVHKLAAPFVLLERVNDKRAATGSNYRYRNAVKTLLLDYYLTKDLVYLTTAAQLVNKYHLRHLVLKRFQYWLCEFGAYIDPDFSYCALPDLLEDVELPG